MDQPPPIPNDTQMPSTPTRKVESREAGVSTDATVPPHTDSINISTTNSELQPNGLDLPKLAHFDSNDSTMTDESISMTKSDPSEGDHLRRLSITSFTGSAASSTMTSPSISISTMSTSFMRDISPTSSSTSPSSAATPTSHSHGHVRHLSTDSSSSVSSPSYSRSPPAAAAIARHQRMEPAQTAPILSAITNHHAHPGVIGNTTSTTTPVTHHPNSSSAALPKFDPAAHRPHSTLTHHAIATSQYHPRQHSHHQHHPHAPSNPVHSGTVQLSHNSNGSTSLHVHPAKRGQGFSCHHCKTHKPPDLLLFCSSDKPGPGKKRCRKKYCESCLTRLYGHPLDQSLEESAANGFICPSCRGCCVCAGCERKVGQHSMNADSRPMSTSPTEEHTTGCNAHGVVVTPSLDRGQTKPNTPEGKPPEKKRRTSVEYRECEANTDIMMTREEHEPKSSTDSHSHGHGRFNSGELRIPPHLSHQPSSFSFTRPPQSHSNHSSPQLTPASGGSALTPTNRTMIHIPSPALISQPQPTQQRIFPSSVQQSITIATNAAASQLSRVRYVSAFSPLLGVSTEPVIEPKSGSPNVSPSLFKRLVLNSDPAVTNERPQSYSYPNSACPSPENEFMKLLATVACNGQTMTTTNMCGPSTAASTMNGYLTASSNSLPPTHPTTTGIILKSSSESLPTTRSVLSPTHPSMTSFSLPPPAVPISMPHPSSSLLASISALKSQHALELQCLLQQQQQQLAELEARIMVKETIAEAPQSLPLSQPTV